MFVLLNKTFISIERFFAYPSHVRAGEGICRLYAITLPCNTIRIIFAAGLKGDKFEEYLGILSTFGLFVRYVKFELGIKKGR